uniref:Uncharacterized protein n=1 Tax=Myotis myotis TaxID=51298 RepID=A0A7J7Z4R7_MYOMY|nr:hypothetical protein mMyoMyo1_010625 [Myotis myotis]
MSSQERNGDQPGCGPGEGQATRPKVPGTSSCTCACGPGEEKATSPAVPSACSCGPGEAACPWSPVAAASPGEAGPGLGCLWLARGREARVPASCNLPKEGILGPGYGARQRQLGAIRPAGEQLGAIRQAGRQKWLGAIRQAEVVRGNQAGRQRD